MQQLCFLDAICFWSLLPLQPREKEDYNPDSETVNDAKEEESKKYSPSQSRSAWLTQTLLILEKEKKGSFPV